MNQGNEGGFIREMTQPFRDLWVNNKGCLRFFLFWGAVLVVAAILFGSLCTDGNASPTGPLLSYQGRLTDSTGANLPDGPYNLVFRIYADSLGGEPIWEEPAAVDLQQGLFTVLLGSQSQLSESVMLGPLRWLGIQVGTSPEITPRTPIVGSVISEYARLADSARTSTTCILLAQDSSSVDLIATNAMGEFVLLSTDVATPGAGRWISMNVPFQVEGSGLQLVFFVNGAQVSPQNVGAIENQLHRVEFYKFDSTRFLVVPWSATPSPVDLGDLSQLHIEIRGYVLATSPGVHIKSGPITVLYR